MKIKDAVAKLVFDALKANPDKSMVDGKTWVVTSLPDDTQGVMKIYDTYSEAEMMLVDRQGKAHYVTVKVTERLHP